MSDIEAFEKQCAMEVEAQGRDEELKSAALDWMIKAGGHNYTYHFKWMGLPIIQYPQDILAMQEIIWDVRPDLIVETGIARGGSLIFYASMLELLGNDGRVVGVDIDIRQHNRAAIESHPMSRRIDMLQGSSTDHAIAEAVAKMARGRKVLVSLDSNHTHDHVLRELELYAPLVGKGSYVVVFDTIIEDADKGFFADRPWDKGNNPKTAVWEFLESHPEFEIDRSIQDKVMFTVSPDGFLKRVK